MAQTTTDPMPAALLKFDLNLFKQSAKEENFVSSPFCVSMAMGMLLTGAHKETKTQIQQVVFKGVPEGEIHGYYTTAMDELKEAKSATGTNAFAVRLFVAHKSDLSDGYQTTLKNTYKITTEQVPFDKPEEAREKINAWVLNRTAGKIKDMLVKSSIQTDASIFIISAFYFKTCWKMGFHVSNTQQLPFYVTDTQKRTVNMMTALNFFAYEDHHDCQVLSLPFAANAGYMCFILPSEKVDFLEFISKINDVKLNLWISKLESGAIHLVKAKIPKFSIKIRVSLKSKLQKLGLTLPFDAQKANFDNMVKVSTSYNVTDLIHLTLMEVNESGIFAEPDTAQLIPSIPMVMQPKLFTVNRPFMFLIISKNSDILFLGHIRKPNAA